MLVGVSMTDHRHRDTHQTTGIYTLDDLFDTLGNRYRRRLLLRMSRPDARGGWELDVSALADETDDEAALRDRLYRMHLPQLSADGYLEWIGQHQTVYRGPTFDIIAPIVRILDEHNEEIPTGWP